MRTQIKLEALDAGADDYITKPFSVEELLARIRVTQRRLAVMQSGEQIESSVFENGGLKIDYTAGCTYLKGEELHLTPIEYKLLCLLSRNVGKVLTHTYITQQIWGRCSDNDVASLRVFYGNIAKKSWSLRKMECNTFRHILALDIACLELRSNILFYSNPRK